jgi:hypothetical protein
VKNSAVRERPGAFDSSFNCRMDRGVGLAGSKLGSATPEIQSTEVCLVRKSQRAGPSAGVHSVWAWKWGHATLVVPHPMNRGERGA